MRRTAALLAALAGLALAGCGGGGGSPTPPPKAPGISGLERSLNAAHGAVTQSQQDAQRASATSAGQ